MQYRWFLSENSTAFFTFSLTLLVGAIIKLRARNQILEKEREDRKNQILRPRGGADTDIALCLEPGKAYELINDAVKVAVRQNFNVAIRQNFNELTRRGPLIVNFAVVIYSYLIANEPLNLFLFTGLKTSITNIQYHILKSMGAVGCGMAILSFFGPQISIFILGSLVAAVLGIATNRINCSDFVRELPQTLPKMVLMKESASNNRIFIVNKEEVDLYVPQSSRRLAGCSEQIVPLTPSWPIWPNNNNKPGLLVDSKCSSKHLPLSARTRTMDDLIEDDVSIRKRLTEDSLKRYEEKERIRIDN